MRLLVTLLFGLFALSLPSPANPSDFYTVTEADKKFLSEVVDSVGRKDAVWIADRMVYPISVVTTKGTRLVKKKEEFTKLASQELTDSIRAKIAEAAKKQSFKNCQGVMVGDGILWFSEYPPDGRNSGRYMISAIGHFAFQPKEAVDKIVRRTKGAY
jgi:hypothetical protein